jgi:hypothetical protein
VRHVNLANVAVGAWALAFFITAVSVQAPGVGQLWFAGMTAWPFNAGWQFEIASFDLALGMLMVIAIRAKVARKILPVLLVLGLLLGGNHLAAALRSGMIGNSIGAGANAVGIVLVIVGLATKPRGSASERPSRSVDTPST